MLLRTILTHRKPIYQSSSSKHLIKRHKSKSQKVNLQKSLLTKTKIVATLGPATESEKKVKALIQAGVDVVRLNFSHGRTEEKESVFKMLRKLSAEHLHQMSILFDIQGPKIRTGIMEVAFRVEPGDVVRVTPNEIVGSKERGFQIRYDTLLKDLKVGSSIFINDGIVKLVVTDVDGEFLVCTVQSGGEISDRKGCNIPLGKLSIDVLTEKDMEDIKLISALKPDFLAASFVGDAADVRKVRAKLEELGNFDTKIIAKIERPIAVENIDEIIEASDGIMVARGDLGVEIDTWLVPGIQKDICSKCNSAGKPVIVATQMLDSMTHSNRPTRAEASDVYNAVLDGTDAVMLSGETSVGSYPIQTVETMDTIIKTAEQYIEPNHAMEIDTVDEIVAHSIFKMASGIVESGKSGRIIIVTTSTNKLSSEISKFRPPMDILTISQEEKIVRQLTLQWGIRSILDESKQICKHPDEKAIQASKKTNELKLIDNHQDFVIFVCRTHDSQPTVTLYERSKFQSLSNIIKH